MKLKSEHVTPYLPYNLYFMRYERKCIDDKVIPVVYSTDEYPKETQLNEVTLNGFDYKKNKLILNPLSKLTEEHALNCRFDNGMEEFINAIESKSIGVIFWNDLLNNHWDVFGLIPNGLAVDKNTIKE